MITLTPTTEQFPVHARILFSLANDINDVATTTDTPGLGLVIPEYLYDRFLRYMDLETEQPSLPVRKKRSQK
jgi:hypothetical protein